MKVYFKKNYIKKTLQKPKPGHTAVLNVAVPFSALQGSLGSIGKLCKRVLRTRCTHVAFKSCSWSPTGLQNEGDLNEL